MFSSVQSLKMADVSSWFVRLYATDSPSKVMNALITSVRGRFLAFGHAARQPLKKPALGCLVAIFECTLCSLH